jgi:ribosomal protein L5
LKLRTTIDKWDCTKLKSLYTAKDTTAKVYILQNVRKMFSLDKVIISIMHKEIKNETQKTNNPINKWFEILKRQYKSPINTGRIVQHP